MREISFKINTNQRVWRTFSFSIPETSLPPDNAVHRYKFHSITFKIEDAIIIESSRVETRPRGKNFSFLSFFLYFFASSQPSLACSLYHSPGNIASPPPLMGIRDFELDAAPSSFSMGMEKKRRKFSSQVNRPEVQLTSTRTKRDLLALLV